MPFPTPTELWVNEEVEEEEEEQRGAIKSQNV